MIEIVFPHTYAEIYFRLVILFSSMDGLNAMLENVLAILRESSYTRAMIELQADVELKDTIVVAMLKLSGQGFYRCNVQVEYEWKPHRYACCKVFGHIQEECPKNPGLGVVKNLKKPSHSSRGVPVGPKVSFKTAKEIDLVLKKAYCQHIAMGTSNLASNGANSSGLSFWNVETSSIRTTPIVDKIRKIEKLIVDGKLTLMDNDGKPLKKVDYPGNHDSEDEVESVDNDMARSMASPKGLDLALKLLKQWSGFLIK
ncbi:hypothetical protein Tco_1004253 [Tanacetum coccineum]|uniref:DUF4283 domain-containing protein n=1 Tax=Tanacetum coccineum TaxID=301880 RepID=A0ABQ5FCP4_9ASTR